MPSSAMHRPGGMNHHQAPTDSAWSLYARLSMFPQVSNVGSPNPMNARAAWVRIAKIVAKMELDTMIGISFGRISTTTMRHARSPAARAASTYSRLRTDRVWARSTRADAAQLVSAMTTISGPSALDLTSAMITMTSGSVGMTRTTLDSRLSASSRNPPAYPPLMPITTETTG